MAPSRPELIFVAGPQEGERGLLGCDVVVLGRSTSCDVQITEQAVSREQAIITLTTDGWVIENLSSNPIRINGKKYKQKKKIVLDTGDVLGFGVRSEVLFVAPGDDADAAVGEYRINHPLPIEVQQEFFSPAPSSAPPADEAAEAPVRPDRSEPEQAGQEATARKAHKAKIRNYVIGGAVYVAVMIVAVVLLMNLKKDGGIETRRVEGRTNLSDSQIAEAVRAPLAMKNVSRHPSEAALALRSARKYYDGWIDRPGDLYRSVKYFKLYLAYKGDNRFENTQDERIFLTARQLLIDRVTETYRAAWVHENQKDWPKAYELFDKIRNMLPVNEEPGAEKNHLVFRNVLAHISYVRRKYQERKRR